ncbi:Sulfite reductase [NADPH] hemoprotein beta-component [Mycovorax composti]|jgi:sulfite reductase (NADPH) hemoprotein, beta-component|uniref:Sulfite reductase [NADPH] hemoprotein beta-component n=1 Tax=Mycovorax composti TaxID=2962693 RepID=A0ABZ2EJ36_9BACT
MSEQNLSAVEKIKIASDGLRGTLKESLSDDYTGAVREDDTNITKFHGMYQQDDRDRREERSMKKLEWLYSFMVRLRIPGGLLKPEQWIAINDVAGKHSTGVIKITTRQTIQLHGILKSHIKPTMKAFNLAGLDSIATCGDVNRNVCCTANPSESPVYDEVFQYAAKISEMAKPKTRAWYEIWLDEERLTEKTEEDPLYKDKYLPRKLKVGIAIPPNNDVDVFINDVVLIAIIENDKLVGFNVGAGGGLGTTHGNPNTYARLASILGFVENDEEKILKVVYEIITVQRDFGNRSDRKQARLKYTIDKLGVDRYREEVEKRCGFKLEPARPYQFTMRQDRYGWVQDYKGKWHYTVFVENGRVLDDEKIKLKEGLYKIAELGKCNFHFTTNQNVILSDIAPKDKAAIEKLLKKYKIIEHTENASAIRKNAIACVALNTCGLALAEAQRYLPTLLSKIEPLLEKHNMKSEDIILRMTGCPNGCGRSPNAEIGFVGTAYGKYNLHIGGDREGLRLNTKFKENLDEAQILETLDELFAVYQKEKKENENFGDFSYRKWIL